MDQVCFADPAYKVAAVEAHIKTLTDLATGKTRTKAKAYIGLARVRGQSGPSDVILAYEGEPAAAVLGVFRPDREFRLEMIERRFI